MLVLVNSCLRRVCIATVTDDVLPNVDFHVTVLGSSLNQHVTSDSSFKSTFHYVPWLRAVHVPCFCSFDLYSSVTSHPSDAIWRHFRSQSALGPIEPRLTQERRPRRGMSYSLTYLITCGRTSVQVHVLNFTSLDTVDLFYSVNYYSSFCLLCVLCCVHLYGHCC